MKKQSKNKKIDEKGSALILTVIVLINALLIVSAITTISVQQKKQASKIKNSTPAFQLADSGIEYALKEKKGNELSTIKDTFDSLTGDGKVKITTDLGLDASGSEGDVYLYFLDDDGVMGEMELVGDVKWIRAVGVYGQGSEMVSRSLQAQVLE
jgi:hypothetical protein